MYANMKEIEFELARKSTVIAELQTKLDTANNEIKAQKEVLKCCLRDHTRLEQENQIKDRLIRKELLMMWNCSSGGTRCENLKKCDDFRDTNKMIELCTAWKLQQAQKDIESEGFYMIPFNHKERDTLTKIIRIAFVGTILYGIGRILYIAMFN